MDLGKKAEKFILDYLDNLNKRVYVARFVDTYDANKGRWGDPSQKKAIVERRPCDAMLIINGKTYFCEVKATTNKTGIYSGLFTKQKGERKRIINAGGSYLYLIYSYALEQWYSVVYPDLNENANWFELEEFKVDLPKVPI